MCFSVLLPPLFLHLFGASHHRSPSRCGFFKRTNFGKDFTMSSKILFTGKTHTTAGQNGVGQSADGFLDIKLPQPHPAAENLFGVAWSGCYMGALEVAASRKKVTLHPGVAVDAQIDLHLEGMEFYLSARL